MTREQAIDAVVRVYLPMIRQDVAHMLDPTQPTADGWRSNDNGMYRVVCPEKARTY